MLAKTDPFNKRNKNGTSPQYIDITVISSTIWTDYTLVDFNMNTPHEAGRHWFLNPKPRYLQYCKDRKTVTKLV